MAITNEERSEVAAMLREDIGLRTFAEIFGFSWTDESDWYWRDVTAKVADYVEPEPEWVCRIIEEEPMVFICSECGGEIEDWYLACPYCGCKVVD